MLAFLKQYNTQGEKAFLALFILAICQETLFIYPITILKGIVGGFASYILPLAYLVLAFFALSDKKTTQYLRIQDFLLIVFFAFYVMFSSVGDLKQATAISEAFVPEILPCIPFLLFGLCLRIDSVSMDTLGKWCCLAVVLTSVYRLLYQDVQMEWEKDYNMGAAYELLPNVFITVNYAFQAKKKIIPIFCSVVGVFYLFAMGTRGPLVVVFAFVFMRYLLYIIENNASKKFITFLVFIGVVGFFISSHFLELLEWLGGVLSSMGLSTRIIDFVVAEEFISDTSSRDMIYDSLIKKMDTLPFFGYGVLGENRFDFLSAHNIYIQAIFDYGFVFGTLILLFLTTISIKSLIKTKGSLSQQWLMIWIVFVFVRGIYGGGVLRFETFMLIGCCLRVLRMKTYDIQ